MTERDEVDKKELPYDTLEPETITEIPPYTLPVKKCQLYSFKWFKTNSRTMIFGLSGSGKSVFFDKLIQSFAKRTFVVLIDTKREYEHIPTLDVQNDFKRKKGIRRVYELVYRNIVIDNLNDVCTYLSENLFERGNCMLVIEEIAEVVPKGAGSLYDVNKPFAKLIQQGRARNVGFIGVSQRPTEVSTTLVSQCNNVITFWFHLPHDKKYFKFYFPQSLMDKLTRFQFLRYQQGDDYLYHHYKLYLSEIEQRFYKKRFGEP